MLALTLDKNYLLSVQNGRCNVFPIDEILEFLCEVKYIKERWLVSQNCRFLFKSEWNRGMPPFSTLLAKFLLEKTSSLRSSEHSQKASFGIYSLSWFGMTPLHFSSTETAWQARLFTWFHGRPFCPWLNPQKTFLQLRSTVRPNHSVSFPRSSHRRLAHLWFSASLGPLSSCRTKKKSFLTTSPQNKNNGVSLCQKKKRRTSLRFMPTRTPPKYSWWEAMECQWSTWPMEFWRRLSCFEDPKSAQCIPLGTQKTMTISYSPNPSMESMEFTLLWSAWGSNVHFWLCWVSFPLIWLVALDVAWLVSSKAVSLEWWVSFGSASWNWGDSGLCDFWIRNNRTGSHEGPSHSTDSKGKSPGFLKLLWVSLGDRGSKQPGPWKPITAFTNWESRPYDEATGSSNKVGLLSRNRQVALEETRTSSTFTTREWNNAFFSINPLCKPELIKRDSDSLATGLPFDF